MGFPYISHNHLKCNWEQKVWTMLLLEMANTCEVLWLAWSPLLGGPLWELYLPGSVFFRALCCSGNSTVQFLSLLKCFLLHQASQAPFTPVTVRGQAFSSVPVWRQPGACSLHGAPQAGTLPPQCVEKGSGARVWVLSWCLSLISLASFSTNSFSSLPSFLLLKVLPRQNLFAFQGFWIVSVLHILFWITYWHF